MLFTILGSFCSFLDRVWADIWPQNRPRKILAPSNALIIHAEVSRVGKGGGSYKTDN